MRQWLSPARRICLNCRTLSRLRHLSLNLCTPVNATFKWGRNTLIIRFSSRHTLPACTLDASGTKIYCHNLFCFKNRWTLKPCLCCTLLTSRQCSLSRRFQDVVAPMYHSLRAQMVMPYTTELLLPAPKTFSRCKNESIVHVDSRLASQCIVGSALRSTNSHAHITCCRRRNSAGRKSDSSSCTHFPTIPSTHMHT